MISYHFFNLHHHIFYCSTWKWSMKLYIFWWRIGHFVSKLQSGCMKKCNRATFGVNSLKIQFKIYLIFDPSRSQSKLVIIFIRIFFVTSIRPPVGLQNSNHLITHEPLVQFLKFKKIKWWEFHEESIPVGGWVGLVEVGWVW